MTDSLPLTPTAVREQLALLGYSDIPDHVLHDFVSELQARLANKDDIEDLRMSEGRAEQNDEESGNVAIGEMDQHSVAFEDNESLRDSWPRKKTEKVRFG